MNVTLISMKIHPKAIEIFSLKKNDDGTRVKAGKSPESYEQVI